MNRIISYPKPSFISFLLSKRPKFISLNAKDLQSFYLFKKPRSKSKTCWSLFPKHMGKRLQPTQADTKNSTYATKGYAFLQRFLDKGFYPFWFRMFIIQYKLTTIAFVAMILFAIMSMAILFYFCAMTT